MLNDPVFPFTSIIRTGDHLTLMTRSQLATDSTTSHRALLNDARLVGVITGAFSSQNHNMWACRRYDPILKLTKNSACGECSWFLWLLVVFGKRDLHPSELTADNAKNPDQTLFLSHAKSRPPMPAGKTLWAGGGLQQAE